MNPLHIPRTVLACVGVAIDTAVRMHCQNRDYEAAVGAAAPKSERGLVEAEAEIEVHESSSSTNCPPGCNAQGWHFSDDNSHVVLHDPALVTFPIDPAASATAAPSPAIPPAGDTDPVGVVDGPPASAAPAGPPSGDLIAAVLGRHRHYMYHIGDHACACGQRFTDYVFWRDHAAEVIAERIEKATSTAQLTRGNLFEAAATIRAAVPYAPVDDDIDIAAHLYALADRLDAAALVYPTP